MKRLYSFAMAMGTVVLATAQLTGVSIESVLTHDASIDPSLDGYTTYRIYADVTSSTDFVSAVFGDASTPSCWDARATSTKALVSTSTLRLK